MIGFWDDSGISWTTICTSLQADNHIDTSSFSFCRTDAFPDAQRTASKRRRTSCALTLTVYRHWVCVCVCSCREGRMAELRVDGAAPVTALSSPGATHLDTDGYLWLGRSVGLWLSVCLSVCSRLPCSIIAKFHYTGPTRTRTDPHGLCRRPARTQRSFAAKKSVRVRAGPVGPVSGPCSGI